MDYHLRLRPRGVAVVAFAGLLLTLLCALLALAGCGPKPAAKPAEVVLKVGNQRGSTRALLESSGLLQGVHYRVEWSEFGAASPLLEALSAGAIDLGAVGDAPFAFAYAAGAPIKAVVAYQLPATGDSVAIVVAKASPIRAVSDLKGRKVATVKGSVGHYLLIRALQKAGVDPRTVQVAFLDPSSSRAALSSGGIDAWATWSPYIGLAVLKDGSRVLADGRGVFSGVGFYAASDKAIAQREPQLRDFLSRVVRAHDWARTHNDVYAARLAKDTGLPLEVAAKMTARLSAPAVPLSPAIEATEHETLEHFREAGVIDRTPDLKGAFAPHFNTVLPPVAGAAK